MQQLRFQALGLPRFTPAVAPSCLEMRTSRRVLKTRERRKPLKKGELQRIQSWTRLAHLTCVDFCLEAPGPSPPTPERCTSRSPPASSAADSPYHRCRSPARHPHRQLHVHHLATLRSRRNARRLALFSSLEALTSGLQEPRLLVEEHLLHHLP